MKRQRARLGVAMWSALGQAAKKVGQVLRSTGLEAHARCQGGGNVGSNLVEVLAALAIVANESRQRERQGLTPGQHMLRQPALHLSKTERIQKTDRLESLDIAFWHDELRVAIGT